MVTAHLISSDFLDSDFLSLSAASRRSVAYEAHEAGQLLPAVQTKLAPSRTLRRSGNFS